MRRIYIKGWASNAILGRDMATGGAMFAVIVELEDGSVVPMAMPVTVADELKQMLNGPAEYCTHRAPAPRRGDN